MSEEKRGMYHSELLKLGEVDATVLSDVTPSKLQGKPPWVALKIDGRKRYYSCENQDCADALDGLKGQTIHMQAFGGREEASIKYAVVKEPGPSGFIGNYGTSKSAFAHTKAEMERETKRFQDADGNVRSSFEIQAAQARSNFAIAWNEAAEVMNLIPKKDAEELSVRDYYDLKLRIAQGIAIEVNRHLR